MAAMSLPAFLPSALAASVLLLSACSTAPSTSATPPVTPATAATTQTQPVRIGVALGGGAAKGFAHIGVLKMLEANGFTPDMVAGTSAGSVVGALYASGMDAFAMQQKAVALDETSIRNATLNVCNLHQLSEKKTIWDGTTFNDTLRTDPVRQKAENWQPPV